MPSTTQHSLPSLPYIDKRLSVIRTATSTGADTETKAIELPSTTDAQSASPTKPPSTIDNVQLHDIIQSPATDPVSMPPGANPPAEYYKALAGQFGTLVLISTFTATLVISFLALSRDIITQTGAPDPVAIIHFDIGMLLGMSTTGCHIGVIVVGGRAAALCFRLAAYDRKSPSRMESNDVHLASIADTNFVRYVRYCNHLHLVANMTLLSFFFFLAYSMFVQKAFFWAFVGASILGGASVFSTGFWKVSMAAEAAKITRSSIRGCLSR